MCETKEERPEDLDEIVKQLKNLQKGNITSDILDAVIAQITDDPCEKKKIARPHGPLLDT